MHELGIIVHINRTLAEVAEENGVSRISRVTLELGEVSGIVPELLSDCWKFYRKKTSLLEEAELVIETLPAVTYCEDCGAHYETVRWGRKCPRCGSGRTYLIKGNECSIKEIEAC